MLVRCMPLPAVRMMAGIMHPRHPRFSFRLLLPLGLLPGVLLWSGCETSPAGARPSGASTHGSNAVADPLQSELHTKALTLQEGAPLDEVRTLLGVPTKTEQITNETGVWDRLIYQQPIAPLYREMVTEMVEVPFVDPINGVESILLEPRAGHQRIERREIISVTFQNGLLVNLTRAVELDHAFVP